MRVAAWFAKPGASRPGLHAPRGAVRLGPLLILVVLCAVLAVLSPVFLTERNVTNLGFQVSIVAVLALGQLLVILTRGIDLSVGSVVALTGVLGAIAFDGSVASSGFGVVLTMLTVGLAVGLLNGVVLVKGRISTRSSSRSARSASCAAWRCSWPTPR